MEPGYIPAGFSDPGLGVLNLLATLQQLHFAGGTLGDQTLEAGSDVAVRDEVGAGSVERCAGLAQFLSGRFAAG